MSTRSRYAPPSRARAPLLAVTLALTITTGCDQMAPGPGGTEPGGEVQSMAAALVPITRVVPLRFVHAMACDPGTVGCTQLLTIEQLRASIDRANEVFAPAGIKFWIKSNEYYFLPKFNQFDKVTLFTWSQVKQGAPGSAEDGLRTVFPGAPSNAYSDAGDSKIIDDWMASLSAYYGDPDEILIWLVTKSSDGTKSYAQFPEYGRHLTISVSNVFNSDGSGSYPTTHLGHELGHFWGQRHPFDNLSGSINPLTGVPFTELDRWDLAYCPAGGGQPTRFFTSKQAFQNANCPNPTRMRVGDNCSSESIYGKAFCTIDSVKYTTGDSEVSELLWQDLTVPHNPPLTFQYGINTMDYYSNYDRSTRTPSGFTPSQVKMIGIYAENELAYTQTASLKRQDGTAPVSGLADGLKALRTKAGKGVEDFIYWANGDLSFASQTKPIIGTNYTPAAGDLDGDGFDDIAWYDPGTGNSVLWWSNGNRTFSSGGVAVWGAGFIPIVGDFDGLHGDDVFLYAPGGGGEKILWSNGNGTFTTTASSVGGTYTPLAGDFDGDGAGDIGWYNPVNGYMHMWWSNGAARTFTAQNWIWVGTDFEPFAGDFDGDTISDLFWYAPGNPADSLWFGKVTRTWDVRATSVYGTYLPIPGDYNGDGRGDIYWDAVGATTDYVWTGTGNRAAPFDTSQRESAYGVFAPVAGKFDGAYMGKNATDIMWYRQ